MRRRIVKLGLVVVGVLGAGAGAGAVREGAAHRLAIELGVVPPLADPALVPGVARCTVDGACTVTDEGGTRRGTPLVVVP